MSQNENICDAIKINMLHKPKIVIVHMRIKCDII